MWNKKDYFEQIRNEIVTSTVDCVKLIDDGGENREDQIVELHYQMELLKEKKELFLNLEVEIERNMNMIEIKNVVPAEVDTSKDVRILTDNDTVNGMPIFLLTEKKSVVYTTKRKAN